MKQPINTNHAPAPIGPYNQAIMAGNTLYVSGQIAIDPVTGNLLADEIDAETVQVMKNIGAILEEAGMTYENIVKCSIFIKDMADFGQINEVYARYFHKEPPARETVAVAGLPKDVNVEISCIAVK